MKWVVDPCYFQILWKSSVSRGQDFTNDETCKSHSDLRISRYSIILIRKKNSCKICIKGPMKAYCVVDTMFSDVFQEITS